jgi:isopentenyldiphosphate isomerase
MRPASDPGDELVDVVDEDDAVVASVTRRRMRAERLRHRCVAVVVRDPAGRVLVHRRRDDKDIWPGRWDLAVGGVVGRGESYDDAAVRELAEEVGITDVSLRFLHHAAYEDEDVREQARLYEVTWDGPLRFLDGEVVEARWVTPAELTSLLERAAFCPDSLALSRGHL